MLELIKDQKAEFDPELQKVRKIMCRNVAVGSFYWQLGEKEREYQRKERKKKAAAKKAEKAKKVGQRLKK